MLRRLDERIELHHPSSRTPRLLQLAVFDLIAGCLYTALVVAAATHGDGAFGRLFWHWVEFEDGGLASLVSVISGQPSSAADPTTIDTIAYRHVVVVCSILTVACVVISCRCWPTWSREFTARLYVRGLKADDVPAFVRAGHRMSTLGLAATVLLIFAIPQNDKAFDFMNSHMWTILCVPILLALCCYFACYAFALRRWCSLGAGAHEFGSHPGRRRETRHTGD